MTYKDCTIAQQKDIVGWILTSIDSNMRKKTRFIKGGRLY